MATKTEGTPKLYRLTVDVSWSTTVAVVAMNEDDARDSVSAHDVIDDCLDGPSDDASVTLSPMLDKHLSRDYGGVYVTREAEAIVGRNLRGGSVEAAAEKLRELSGPAVVIDDRTTPLPLPYSNGDVERVKCVVSPR